MPTQLRLTSIDAYHSLPTHSIRRKVLECLIKYGPHTCEELEHMLRMKHQTVSARIRELFEEHKLKDSGIRRKTESGRKAIVWSA